MNAKLILSLVTLGILMVSSLGVVSAGEINLWLSKTNNIGNHGSTNMISIESAQAITTDNRIIELNVPTEKDGKRKYIQSRSCYLPFKYNGREHILAINLTFRVYRTSGTQTTYSREVFPTVQLPVYDGYVCGVNDYNEYVGMYFTADNHYPKPNECKMDTIHCFIKSKELFNCPGGKYHESQTWTVNYPNGQVWVK